MKLCVNVLLLALVVISGHCDESNECDSDFSSHLHLATKATKATKASPLISEIQIPGNEVEISGTPLASLTGCVWQFQFFETIFTGQVQVIAQVAGTSLPNFDGNGLVKASLPTFPGLFGIALSDTCPGTTTIFPVIASCCGQLLDVILVPLNAASATLLQSVKDVLGPPVTNLPFFGAQPDLVFRSGSTGDLFQVVGGTVFRANGDPMPVLPGDFFPPTPQTPTLTPMEPNPTFVGFVGGDPHIHTLDGGHYTLLREGSFLLWRFGLPQPHVEWQIFAHYAGHQSFTKGLLLVDTSGSEPSSMEITSERCEWQTQRNSKKWSAVKSEVPQVLVSGPSSRMQPAGNPGKDMKIIQLFIADEQVPVATLKVMCRQGRHINLKLYMENQKWTPFVSGELKGQRGQEHKLSSNNSMLQLATREDQEFEVKKSWAELGGSPHAQQYLQTFDENGKKLAFSRICDSQAQADARALCQKHLGTAAHSSYFEECVYDVCSGAGEVAAEMAAEMLKF
eukprot:s421_g46.t1